MRGQYPSVVARTIHPALSSKISYGVILVFLLFENVFENVVDFSSSAIWSGDTNVFACISFIS